MNKGVGAVKYKVAREGGSKKNTGSRGEALWKQKSKSKETPDKCKNQSKPRQRFHRMVHGGGEKLTDFVFRIK
jgi:hypothetical protein